MKYLFQVICLFLYLSSNIVHAKWWYLGLENDLHQTENSSQRFAIKDTSSLNGLSKRFNLKWDMEVHKYCSNLKRSALISPMQQKFCLKSVKLMNIVAKGAKLAINECQHQFKYMRWNCTTYNQPHVFGRIIRTKSKETAFIYAINSAALMYEVTRACTRGDLRSCVCDKKVKPDISNSKNNHKWTGCSENVIYGYKLSKKFVDSDEKKSNSAQSNLINIHNNEAGRQVILRNMKQFCKCHGVSGSCSIKVCWKVMPEFRVIGNEIMKRYSSASRTESKQIIKRMRQQRETVSMRQTMNSDLIFLQRSPNFCRKINKNGIVGTSQRLCGQLDQSFNSTNIQQFSEIHEKCGDLCCGRSFYSKVKEIEEDCQCEFQWASMSVKCKRCKENVIQYFCN